MTFLSKNALPLKHALNRPVFLPVLFLLVSLLLPARHFAQQFTSQVSETFRSDGSMTYRKLGHEFYSLAQNFGNKFQLGFTFKLHKVKYSMRLRRYDSTMQIMKEQELFKEDKKAGPFPPYLGTHNGKLYLLYFLYEKEEENIRLMMADIDPASLNVLTEKELLAIPQANTGLIKSWDVYTSTNIVVKDAPDGSRLLIYWANDLNNQFSFCVLDNSFNPTWKMNETVKGTDAISQFSACMDSEGRVYTNYSLTATSARKIAIYQEGKKVKEHNQQLSAGSIYQSFVVSSRKDKLIHIAGSYTTQPGKLNGLFQQTINTADLSITKPVAIPFENTLVEQLDKDGWGSTKSKNYGIDPLGMQGFALSDGRIALVGEYRKSNWTGRANFITSGSLVYAILDGSQAKVASIPKYRTSAGSTIGDSYAAFPYNNTLLIFYNDLESNLQRDITKPSIPSNVYKNAVLAVAYMNGEGMRRQTLIDLTKDNFLAIGEGMYPLQGNKVLIPVHKIKGLGGVGNDQKWGYVNIE
jgi:hypothetical protein